MDSDWETLKRWQDFGGAWRVIDGDGQTVTISMYRCDGGEEVQRLISHEADLIAWLAQHPRSEPE